MKMEFTVNYSPPLVDLLRDGRIHLDRFKCPAWPQAVAEAQRIHACLDTFAPFAGEPIDHLPMTDTDWPFLAWALAEIDAGHWGRPSIVAYEYGGIGPVFEAITDGETSAAQLPRMYEMVKRYARPTAVSMT